MSISANKIHYLTYIFYIIGEISKILNRDKFKWVSVVLAQQTQANKVGSEWTKSKIKNQVVMNGNQSWKQKQSNKGREQGQTFHWVLEKKKTIKNQKLLTYRS